MAAMPYEILTFVGRGTGARDYDLDADHGQALFGKRREQPGAALPGGHRSGVCFRAGGAAPDGMGSDWSHTTESEKPDDALLFDLLKKWIPTAADQTRILVENPAKLYGFDAPA
jgi:hypothetical protein